MRRSTPSCRSPSTPHASRAEAPEAAALLKRGARALAAALRTRFGATGCDTQGGAARQGKESSGGRIELRAGGFGVESL